MIEKVTKSVFVKVVSIAGFVSSFMSLMYHPAWIYRGISKYPYSAEWHKSWLFFILICLTISVFSVIVILVIKDNRIENKILAIGGLIVVIINLKVSYQSLTYVPEPFNIEKTISSINETIRLSIEEDAIITVHSALKKDSIIKKDTLTQENLILKDTIHKFSWP